MGGAPSMPTPPAPIIQAPAIQPTPQDAAGMSQRNRAAGAVAGMMGGTIQNQGGAMGLAPAPGAAKSLLGA